MNNTGQSLKDIKLEIINIEHELMLLNTTLYAILDVVGTSDLFGRDYDFISGIIENGRLIHHQADIVLDKECDFTK